MKDFKNSDSLIRAFLPCFKALSVCISNNLPEGEIRKQFYYFSLFLTVGVNLLQIIYPLSEIWGES